MNEENKKSIDEIKKEIVIERLRQAPANVKISFGEKDGNFMSCDEMIEQVKKNTEIGNKIVKIQIEYLKAFKKGILIGG